MLMSFFMKFTTRRFLLGCLVFCVLADLMAGFDLLFSNCSAFSLFSASFGTILKEDGDFKMGPVAAVELPVRCFIASCSWIDIFVKSKRSNETWRFRASWLYIVFINLFLCLGFVVLSLTMVRSRVEGSCQYFWWYFSFRVLKPERFIFEKSSFWML